ncbi:MAG: 23S rRNA (pseudouridine(1915)-N(3))-methyltransferase RlmH [Myxococcales bacterium]|nr:23S rRNA (pseudouridine(1915)-N(3))-methyltransferase RlmH [Myxococcales bacterium]
MKLTFLSVGKDRSGLFAPGVEEYASRLSHVAKVQLVELHASKASGVKAKTEEGEALLAKLSPRDALVALDERGRALSSVDFAAWLGRQQDSGRDVAFAIGGDEGLADEVRTKAALVLSLSAMTLPHRLARLVLLEQVYRAFTILRREPYHK